jgi:predicted Zn-dependent protease
MSVAAFFRDPRVQGALAGDKSAASGELLAEFFAAYGYAQCTPQQLLVLSDLAVRCGDVSVARAALDDAVKSGQAMHQAFYRLGRLALSENDPAAAARHFHLGTEADAEFAFNWMGEARALLAQGLKDAALAPAETFIGFGVRPHAPADLAALADVGDYLFDAGQRRRCQKFFECVVRHRAESPRDAVRLADILAGFNDHAAAQELLLDQQKRGRLDAAGQRALALSLSQSGEHARAVDLAEAAMLQNPLDEMFVAAYLDILARAADPAGIAAALARHADLLGTDAVVELRARSKMPADLSAAAAALDNVPLSHQSRLYYLAVDLAYAALGAGKAELAMQLATRLNEAAPEDIFIKLLRVETCFRQQLWEQAANILAGMNEAETTQPQVILKRFELACFTNDALAAEALFTQLDSMQQPNRQFRLPVFRYLAERQRWNDLVDRALPWLDPAFNYRQIGYVLFRAAKYTNRQDEMISAIEAVDGWASRPDLLRLRASLALDIAGDAAALDQLAHDPAFVPGTPLRARLDIQRAVLAASLRKPGRRALLLCAEANYLTGAFVALRSVMHNAAWQGIDVFIAVDDELTELTGRAAAPFIEAGLRVTILPASAIVPAGQELSPEYGMFYRKTVTTA